VSAGFPKSEALQRRGDPHIHNNQARKPVTSVIGRNRLIVVSRMPSEEQLLRMLVRIERALSVIALAQMILTIILTRIKNGK
jgi:hypothetical protein